MKGSLPLPCCLNARADGRLRLLKLLYMLYNIKKSLPFILLCLAAIPAGAQEVGYGPYDGSQPLSSWGTNLSSTYDIALHITDSRLVGKQVSGIVVPFDSITTPLLSLKAWTATELKETGMQYLASQSGDIKAGMDTIRFAQPCTIPEGGLYVGFTLTASTSKVQPIRCISNDPAPDTYYLLAPKVYRKWKDRHGGGIGTTAMQVLITGLDNYAVTPQSRSDINALTGQAQQASFTINNYGSQKVSSVEYAWSLNGQSGSKTVPVNISNHYGAAGTINVDVPAMDNAGAYPLDITISKVNGQANSTAATQAEALLVAYNTQPVHRPVLEEYTGTWCGYCPRGWVGLERMNALYPNDFIAISYHNDDPMAFTADYPSDVPGFPYAMIDRQEATDAYCGNAKDSRFHVDDVWKQHKNVFSPIAINATAQFTDSTHVEVTATTTYGKPMADNNYALSFVLTADSLQGNSQMDTEYKLSPIPNSYGTWQQHSYYQGLEGAWPDTYMDQFTKGDEYQYLMFNDVAVAWSGKSYLEGSQPASVEADEPYTSQYTFDTSNITSVYYEQLTGKYESTGLPIIQHKDALHVVVLLIDKTSGQVINAAKCYVKPLKDATGISNLQLAPAKAITSYYTLDGKRLQHPQKGLNIVRTSDGKTFKLMR